MSKLSVSNIALFLISAVFFSGCGAGASNSTSNASTTNSTSAANTKPANSGAADSVKAPTPAAAAFSKSLELHGIKFVVESPNSATGNTVTIKPAGLEVSNDEVKRNVLGLVIDAEIADLNVDRSPEVYIYVARKAGESKGSELIAFSSNSRKSMSEVNIGADDPKDLQGFKGEDEYSVIESTLVRRFPLFDADSKRSGKTRQIQYKLKMGEAAWQLVKDKVIEY